MEQRKKCASILLNIRSKMTRISLYDFALFSAQNEDAGLYRVQINRKWHSPDGKYTAFSPAALAVLLTDLIGGTPPPPPPDIKPGTRVYAHWQGDDNLLDAARDKGWQIDGEGNGRCKKCALLGEAPKVRLKPCPHCGEPEVRLMEHEAFAYVACPTMGCWMHGPMKESADAAVKAWDALPRHEDVERLNREADWLAEHLHRAGIPCPGDGEKFDPYGECAKKGWPCVACFREWARQQTQEEKSDGQENGN